MNTSLQIFSIQDMKFTMYMVNVKCLEDSFTTRMTLGSVTRYIQMMHPIQCILCVLLGIAETCVDLAVWESCVDLGVARIM